MVAICAGSGGAGGGALVGQGIDVEGPHDRWIEAPEVEDEDLGEKARRGLQHRAAGRPGDPPLGLRGNRDMARAQGGAVDPLEGRDARPREVEGDPGQGGARAS